ncbi:LacI family transcriptional regulator [Suicoccus acidiformans]|uniref:LacI family transcriptional regulator n=1 Tax=Suicoccus acidiformans TaxID=2036206 RepID=A0A347WKW9_9LACT|nr:LacI family DNA-binding transcriptional regulator [Suicoccus acidiformans]AXY25726.1 LacI family transcriptional regulator [Suicoccus acidiformans]
MTTLKDIAQLAQVSKSTVSRYLNNGQVSEKTAKKIEQVIAETGYEPNALARSLKATSSQLIGVIIPRFNSSSTSEVLAGIDEVAMKEGYNLLILNSNQNLQQEMEHIQTLDRQNVAGIILFSQKFHPALLDIVSKTKAKIMILGQSFERFNYTTYDDYQAGKLIAQHAIDLGHKDLLYINPSEEDEAVGKVRAHGFIDWVEQYPVKYQVISSSFDRLDNYRLAHQILPDITATYIACATDRMAISFLKAAIELEIEVPSQLSLSGFGGYNDGQFVHPNLTTVKYPFKEAGQVAMQSLLEGIEDQTEELKQITLGVELLQGKSTGPKKS